MVRKGRPLKPLHETTRATAVKIKHIAEAQANGLTLSGYIEMLIADIKRRENAIGFLQDKLTKAGEKIEQLERELKMQEELELKDMQEAEQAIRNYNY